MTKKWILYLCSVAMLALASSANATIILTNGSVTFDNGNGLTEFAFTLTSDTDGEFIDLLTFDGDGGASWDETTAATVYESHAWTPLQITPVAFFEGALDNRITFDGINGIDFNYIFVGAENVVGNPWQLSAGVSGPIDVINNIDIATGQAGTVSVPVSEPSVFFLVMMSLFGLRYLRKG